MKGTLDARGNDRGIKITANKVENGKINEKIIIRKWERKCTKTRIFLDKRKREYKHTEKKYNIT